MHLLWAFQAGDWAGACPPKSWAGELGMVAHFSRNPPRKRGAERLCINLTSIQPSRYPLEPASAAILVFHPALRGVTECTNIHLAQLAVCYRSYQAVVLMLCCASIHHRGAVGLLMVLDRGKVQGVVRLKPSPDIGQFEPPLTPRTWRRRPRKGTSGSWRHSGRQWWRSRQPFRSTR